MSSLLPKHVSNACVMWVALTTLPCTTSTASEPQANQELQSLMSDWESTVQPILAEHCVQCHGAAKKSAGLDLRTLASLLAGSDAGSVTSANTEEPSRIVAALEGADLPAMPPEAPLQAEVRQKLVDWLRAVSHFDTQDILALGSANEDHPEAATSSNTWLPTNIAPRLAVDVAVQARWTGDIKDHSLCDDTVFVRRAYLDLCGRVPNREESASFLKSTSSNKREELVDQLLNTHDHAVHLADVFDAILMGRRPKAVLQQRQSHGWRDYLVRNFSENRPWNQVAREILLARPEGPSDQAAPWYLYERKNQHQEIAEAIARGVFGVQIQCAQCHDHPIAEEIKQEHYWGLVAFFNRGQNDDQFGSPMVAESAIGGFAMFTNLEGESHPNTLTFLGSSAVAEDRPAEGEKEEDREALYVASESKQPRVPRFSRRQKFVEDVLQGHPLVARAMVNRLWAITMGRGLVHPVDALDSVHSPSHPQLLDWLSQDFERHGYDVRRTLKELVLSRTYQLPSQSDQFHDPALFELATTKPLTAEALFRSVHVVLEIPIPSDTDLVQQLDGLRTAFPEVLAETTIGNLRQALLLTNGADIHQWISADRSPWIRELISDPSDSIVVDEAFLQILGRRPAPEEQQRSLQYLKDRVDRRDDGIKQFVWALMTSAEFRFNH